MRIWRGGDVWGRRARALDRILALALEDDVRAARKMRRFLSGSVPDVPDGLGYVRPEGAVVEAMSRWPPRSFGSNVLSVVLMSLARCRFAGVSADQLRWLCGGSADVARCLLRTMTDDGSWETSWLLAFAPVDRETAQQVVGSVAASMFSEAHRRITRDSCFKGAPSSVVGWAVAGQLEGLGALPLPVLLDVCWREPGLLLEAVRVAAAVDEGFCWLAQRCAREFLFLDVTSPLIVRSVGALLEHVRALSGDDPAVAEVMAELLWGQVPMVEAQQVARAACAPAS